MAILCFCVNMWPFHALSQQYNANADKDSLQFSPQGIKKLSVEELMNIEVTSVSKSPEKLTEVASAIQVITSEDISRSTVTRLPEALRLASNLQVAQSNSHDFAVTARGFNAAPLSNNTLSNKLLVMIDGRTVYDPLFGGVFWDVQNVLTEDIDRIEVISGPGGSLWGANAINGVINITSKSAKATQGVYASGSYGSFLKDYGAVRYGSHVDSVLYFRVYAQRFDQNSTVLSNGASAKDAWNMNQGGFRMDYLPSVHTTVTLQGDIYKGKENDITSSFVNGQNVLGRWSHNFQKNSDISVQAYYDRTWRSLPYAKFKTELATYDIDVQHHFNAGNINRILWGAGYRLMNNRTDNSPTLSFNPANRKLKLFNAFVQDQVALIPQKLEFTAGTKLLHNDYTGYEWQPSARLAWTPDMQSTVWTAVSRSVRTPSRFDVDEVTSFIATPGNQFYSENVIAYELGYRMRPTSKVSVSVAGYYNKYTDLRSINRNSDAPTAIIFANDQRANAWGAEISGNVIISAAWRLRGGYTYLHKKITATSGNVYPGDDLFEGLDPKNQAMLQSVMSLPRHFQFDLTARYIDGIQKSPITPAVPSYFSLNTRLAWEYRYLSVALMGENLTQKAHAEFGSLQIPRSVYTTITVRF